MSSYPHCKQESKSTMENMNEEDKPFQLHDTSNDKKYFTIVPNYVIETCGHTDLALYIQLKRLSGDTGIAYPSGGFLMKKLDISKNTLIKSFRSLLDKNLIKREMDMAIDTKGGIQHTKAYSMVDIWGMNSQHFTRGVQNMTPLKRKGGSKYDAKGVQNSIPKKNHINKMGENYLETQEKELRTHPSTLSPSQIKAKIKEIRSNVVDAVAVGG